jgi:hypothetical protein
LGQRAHVGRLRAGVSVGSGSAAGLASVAGLDSAPALASAPVAAVAPGLRSNPPLTGSGVAMYPRRARTMASGRDTFTSILR